MKKIVFSFLMFISLYFLFNNVKVNTIDDISLTYEEYDLDEEKYFNVSFYNFNINNFQKVLENLNIKIISVIPENSEKIYFTNYNKLLLDYQKNIVESINGNSELVNTNFNIRSMLILCTKNELIKLEDRIDII